MFALFVLFWIGLGWLGIILALLGIFFKTILMVYFFIFGLGLAYLAVVNSARIKFNRIFFLILCLLLGAIVLFSSFTTPTIFSGRDQGSLSEAAIRLAQNHQLEFSLPAADEFFKIYGPGKALNFPGFNYTQTGNLITQFPVGYIAWLAVFYSFLGLPGLVLANGISFFIFLLSFYLIARQYLRGSSSFIAFLLVLTSFVFSWFFKFTLSENLALMLLWFGLYQFVLFIKNAQQFNLLACFLSIGLLAFARIEALAFFAIMLIILWFHCQKNWRRVFSIAIGKKISLVFAGIIILYFFNLAANSQAYVALVKGMIKPFLAWQQNIGNPSEGWQIFYVARIFMAYDLLIFVFLGAAGFVSEWKNKKFTNLIPYLIVLPAFFYLLQPSVSADHPWMLRRFVFAVIPISILYALMFLERFFQRPAIFYFFSSALVATNLLIFTHYLDFSPSQNLLPQIQKIGDNLNADSLILVDKNSTGDGWSMMTGPLNFLYGKQAVYFFNPADLDKIDRSKFSAIYFIIPEDSLGMYRNSGILEKLIPQKDYVIENSILTSHSTEKKDSVSLIELPEKINISTQGKIYLLKK